MTRVVKLMPVASSGAGTGGKPKTVMAERVMIMRVARRGVSTVILILEVWQHDLLMSFIVLLREVIGSGWYDSGVMVYEC